MTNGLLDNQNCSYIVNIRHNELEIEIEIYLGCASASIFMVIGYLLALCPVGSLQALTERSSPQSCQTYMQVKAELSAIITEMSDI